MHSTARHGTAWQSEQQSKERSLERGIPQLALQPAVGEVARRHAGPQQHQAVLAALELPDLRRGRGALGGGEGGRSGLAPLERPALDRAKGQARACGTLAQWHPPWLQIWLAPSTTPADHAGLQAQRGQGQWKAACNGHGSCARRQRGTAWQRLHGWQPQPRLTGREQEVGVGLLRNVIIWAIAQHVPIRRLQPARARTQQEVRL